MRAFKRMGLLAAVLASLLCLSTAAESDAGAYQTVVCPEQGFSTRCEAGLAWRWDGVYGLTIQTGEVGGPSCLMIRVVEGGGRDFEGYFEGVLTPWLQSRLGEDLLSAGDFAVYTLGEGIELPGAMYVYLDAEGRRQVLFRLFDGRWDRAVCYTLRYPDGAGDDALRALGVAVNGFSMEPGTVGTAAPEAARLDGAGEIACPEQGFAARCDGATSVRWQAGAGLYVYLGEAGRPPYVLVNVAEGTADIPAFFDSTATPWMRWRYGDALTEVIDCGNLTVEGRVMRGVGYRYRANGEAMYALRLLENREGYSAGYVVKFREDAPEERREAMEALDAIAASLRRESTKRRAGAG